VLTCVAFAAESRAARYTIAPSPPVSIDIAGVTSSLSLEPVSDVRGGTDVEDTLTPSNYYATQDPLPTAHWTFAGFNSSPFETAILIVVYDGGSIATLPPSSRQLQISLLFYNGTRIALPSIAVVPVPEPCGLLLATASAVVLRRLRRPRGRRVTAAPSDPAALLQ